MRNYIVALRLLVVTVCSFVSAAQAQPVRVAAYIVGLDHPSYFYLINRGNFTVPAQFYTPLINNDWVRVLDPRASLVIRFVDGRVYRITRANSPIRIWSATSSPSAVDNMSGVVWQNLEKSRDSGLQTAGGRTLDSPTEEPLRLLLPGLSEGAARIAPGKRILAVEWRGGAPPFSLTANDGTGAVVLDEPRLLSRRFVQKSDPIHFKLDTYSLSIGDRLGGKTQATFQVVDPVQPMELAPPSFMKGDARDTWSAAWLVQTDRQRLSYEAYLRIQGAAERDFQPAVELRLWLGAGAPSK